MSRLCLCVSGGWRTADASPEGALYRGVLVKGLLALTNRRFFIYAFVPRQEANKLIRAGPVTGAGRPFCAASTCNTEDFVLVSSLQSIFLELSPGKSGSGSNSEATAVPGTDPAPKPTNRWALAASVK